MIKHVADHRHSTRHPLAAAAEFAVVKLRHRAIAVQGGDCNNVITARATPEMMQLSRDEHDLIAEMIKAQLAAERSQFQKQKLAQLPSEAGRQLRALAPIAA